MNSTIDRIAYNYWQLTTSNVEILCPYDHSCMGGVYRVNITTNGSRIITEDYPIPNSQCYSSFKGFLCSEPSSSKDYLDPILRDVSSCAVGRYGINYGYLSVVLLLLIFLVYFVCIVRYVSKPIPSLTYQNPNEEEDDEDDIEAMEKRDKDMNKTDEKGSSLAILLWLRLLLFYFQVASQLPTILYQSFPPVTSYLIRSFGFLSLSSILLVPFDCLSSSSSVSSLPNRVSYYHLMYLSTILPISFFIFLFVITWLLNEIAYLDNPFDYFDNSDESDEESQLQADDDDGEEEGEEGIRRGRVVVDKLKRDYQQFNYFYKLFAAVYFFFDLWVGNIAQMLFGSLFCVQLNDNPALSSSQLLVLWNDPSIQCHQSDFFSVFTVMWVIGSIIFFLFLLPLIEAILLRVIHHRLSKQINAKKRSETGGIDPLSNLLLFDYLHQSYGMEGGRVYSRLFETVFRVVFIGLLPILLTQDKRIYKTILTVIVLLVFAMAMVKWNPFKKIAQQRFLESVCLVVLILLVLMMIGQIGEIDLADSRSYDAVSVFLLCLPLSVIIYEAFFSRSSCTSSSSSFSFLFFFSSSSSSSSSKAKGGIKTDSSLSSSIATITSKDNRKRRRRRGGEHRSFESRSNSNSNSRYYSDYSHHHHPSPSPSYSHRYSPHSNRDSYGRRGSRRLRETSSSQKKGRRRRGGGGGSSSYSHHPWESYSYSYTSSNDDDYDDDDISNRYFPDDIDRYCEEELQMIRYPVSSSHHDHLQRTMSSRGRKASPRPKKQTKKKKSGPLPPVMRSTHRRQREETKSCRSEDNEDNNHPLNEEDDEEEEEDAFSSNLHSRNGDSSVLNNDNDNDNDGKADPDNNENEITQLDVCLDFGELYPQGYMPEFDDYLTDGTTNTGR